MGDGYTVHRSVFEPLWNFLTKAIAMAVTQTLTMTIAMTLASIGYG